MNMHAYPTADPNLPYKGFKLPDPPEGRQIGWSPLEGSQSMVLAHPFVFELLYHGTRGPGKSDTLIMDFCQFIGKGWGLQYKGVIFRQSFPQLADLITKTKRWFPIIFPGARYNGSDHKWLFPDGEELLFRQFDKPDDYWKYHGQEFQFIGWDELTNWASLDGYKSMMSCLRSTHPDIPMRVRATTNPYGRGHNVVKFYFELPAKDGILMEHDYEFENPQTGATTIRTLTRLCIKGTIYENTILLAAQPDYIAQLKAQADNPAKMAAWLLGSWDIVAGGMFDDVWNGDINIVRRFAIPISWRIDRSFDWGSSAPFSVGWWAESDGSDYIDGHGQYRSSVRGDMFRVAEWYGWNGEPNKGLRMLAVDVAKEIRERDIKMFPKHIVHPGPADSAIYNEENGMSIGRDMEQRVRLSNGETTKGVFWTKADKRSGSRKAGWELLRKMIRDAGPNRDDKGKIVAGPRENPGLFIMDHCDQFIRTVPLLPRDEKDMDDVDTTAEDHIGDETRYRLRSVGMRITTGTTTGLY